MKLIVLVVSAGVFAFSGCRHVGERQGHASLEFLAPAGVSAPKDKAGEITEVMTSWVNHIDAHPRASLAKPVYPIDVLKAGGESCVIYVMISIDDHGKVTDVSSSWDHVSTPTKYLESFLCAITDAAMSWRIEPAVDVYWERKDGQDQYIRSEPKAARFEVKFTFDTSGAVR